MSRVLINEKIFGHKVIGDRDTSRFRNLTYSQIHCDSKGVT